MLPNWSRRQQTAFLCGWIPKSSSQQPPKYGIPCEGEKPSGLGRTDMLGGTGGSAWNNFSRNIQGQVPAQPCALPAPQSWLNFQWMIFMALKTSEQGFCISREPNAEGHHLLQVGETGVGMGQDLILRLQPHPCADTSQPLHLCRCLSPFLVPKLISNSLLNHFEKLLCK